MPKSPILESRVTMALSAEKRPNVAGPKARAVMTVKIIPTTAMVARPVKLIRVSLPVWEKNSLLILSTELFYRKYNYFAFWLVITRFEAIFSLVETKS